MHIQANYSLQPHNSFQLDVSTQYYVEINRQSDILTLRGDIKLASLPWRIIGDGSNLLFTDNIEGVVVTCSYKKLKVVKEDKDTIWISVGAGMDWHELVTYTVNHNLWGLENLALIPGKVGAAPVQNIGAYGSEAQDSITRVQTLNLYNGKRTEFRNAQCNFSYRNSIFKKEYQNKLLIHRVTFRLRKLHGGQANLAYEPLKKALQHIPKEQLTPQKVYDAVVHIRKSKIPDPKIQGNAGSFFKNPVIDAHYLDTLRQRYPDIPSHKMLDNRYKVPAAWLIEQAGWKGRTHGQAGVSNQHALILINRGQAKGQDIVELFELIQADINHKFGIHLEPEVIILKA